MSYKRAKKSIMKNSKWKNYFDKYAQIQMSKEWAKQGLCELFFYDESGFSLNSNIPYRWSPIGSPLKIPANRFSKRINVLGFLNTQTKKLVHAMTTDKVDTQVVIDVFDSFAKQITKTTICVLDNASIHTSKKFKAKIDEWEKLGLHLLYLPPYSPELNPIEMLWREMKYTWMDLNVLDSFEDFYKHIDTMLNLFVSEYVIYYAQALNNEEEKMSLCPLCNGEKVQSHTTFTLELGFGVVVVRHVPALVCVQCGSDWISDETAEKLEVLVKSAKKNHSMVE